MVLAIPTLPNQRSLAAQSCETERSIELGPVLCLCFARPAKRRHWDSCRHRRQNTLPWLVTIQTHSTTTFFSGMPMVEQTSFTHLSNLVSISQSLIILPHVRMYTRQVEPIWGSGRSSDVESIPLSWNTIWKNSWGVVCTCSVPRKCWKTGVVPWWTSSKQIYKLHMHPPLYLKMCHCQGANVDESSWARIIFSNQMSKQHPFNYILKTQWDAMGLGSISDWGFSPLISKMHTKWWIICQCTSCLIPTWLPLDCLCLMLSATPYTLTLTFSCSQEKVRSFISA